MKCKQIKELMGAYLYGDLSPEEMREVRLHANACGGCREDLRTRGAAVASVGDRVPDLTDLEKQRIAWYVEGAVRRNDARAPAGLRLAPILAGGTIAIAAGVAIGALIASNLAKPSVQQAQRDRRPPARATVRIQEEPVGATAKDKSETALNKPDEKAKDSETLRITNAIADAMKSALRGGAGVASRSGPEMQRRRAEPEEVIEEVSTSAESPKDESQTSPTKLPKPSDLNDARTSPSHDGE
jgi:hypothetical protein